MTGEHILCVSNEIIEESLKFYNIFLGRNQQK